MLPAYIKEIGEKIIYDGDGEIVYYVPEKYFELSIANVIGEYVETMGVFQYCEFSKSGKAGELKPFKHPTIFQCKPSLIEKVSDYHLQNTKVPSGYRILHFKNKDELISQTSTPQVIENVEKFMNLLKGGHLPDHIPYNEIQDYVIMNAKLNDFSYKVSTQIIGLIISEIYRNPKDLSIPFRHTSMDDMRAYKAINVNKVPKYASTYTALTSENADEAIAGAMINTGTAHSPLEVMLTQ